PPSIGRPPYRRARRVSRFPHWTSSSILLAVTACASTRLIQHVGICGITIHLAEPKVLPSPRSRPLPCVTIRLLARNRNRVERNSAHDRGSRRERFDTPSLDISHA